MKTPQQLSEEVREVSASRAWLVVAVAMFALMLSAFIARADVIRLTLPSTMTASQQTMCGRVQEFWNRLVATRNLPGAADLMSVTVLVVPIDGRPETPNIWSQSYASSWVGNTVGKYVFHGGAGRIHLDEANLPFWSDEILSWVMFHELGHFFGWQTPIWQANGCLNAEWNYIGPAGLAAYRLERDAAATFIPMAADHFADSLSPWFMTAQLNGSWVPRTLPQMLKDNGYTLSAYGEQFQGGPLATVMPRRLLLMPIIITSPPQPVVPSP